MAFFGLSYILEFIQGHICFSACLLLGYLFYVLILRKITGGSMCKSDTSLVRKTAIVTGANSGIGKETARDLAKRGARVILACRDLDKANKAAKEIKIDTNGDVVVKHLDLASFESIRKFVNDIIETEDRINILVNNAGIIADKGTTVDGNDLIFQTNYLGPFLLTNLLLPKIRKSIPARIVNLSSFLHVFGYMDWNDLNKEKPGKFNALEAYFQSKLANLSFTRELARRILGSGIMTYAVHAAYVDTNLAENITTFLPYWIKIFSTPAKLFSKTPTQGAQTSIYCAVSKDVAFKSGWFYSNCKETKIIAKARDMESEKRLWNISAKMVNLPID